MNQPQPPAPALSPMQQVLNLNVAIAFIDRLPERQINLDAFSLPARWPDFLPFIGGKVRYDCRCIGGWVTQMAHFREMGVQDFYGVPVLTHPRTGTALFVGHGAEYLFGDPKMFLSHQYGEDRNHKVAALTRLRKQRERLLTAMSPVPNPHIHPLGTPGTHPLGTPGTQPLLTPLPQARMA
jgi:hypothetical protein